MKHLAQPRSSDTDVETTLDEGGGRPPSSEAIQHAAFDLFARRGYVAASVREVMKACGLTQGALYNHFPSKNQLLATLIQTTQDGLEAECSVAIRLAGEAPPAQLRAFVQAFTRRHCERRTEALVANRDFGWLKPSNLHDIVASRRRIRDMLVAVLERGEREGIFRLPRVRGHSDVRIVAMAILNQCIYVSNWFRPDGPWTQEAVAELHAELALRMVGAEA
jgi:AcrR family transcriptional regulator